MGLKAKRTSAYRPQTNGKAERFIKTLQNEWAYGMPFASSEERKRWLPRYLSIDNGRRCQMAIGSRTPVQQLERLRVTETVLDTERVGEVVPLMLPEMETEEVLLKDGLPELEAVLVAASEPGVG